MLVFSQKSKRSSAELLLEVRMAEAPRVAVLLSPAKMSSKAHALPSQMTTKRGGFWREYFYFFMTLLIAATAVYGFSHTIDHNLIHRSPLPPFVLYIHAIVFPRMDCVLHSAIRFTY
jgi:hypothetical protein